MCGESKNRFLSTSAPSLRTQCSAGKQRASDLREREGANHLPSPAQVDVEVEEGKKITGVRIGQHKRICVPEDSVQATSTSVEKERYGEGKRGRKKGWKRNLEGVRLRVHIRVPQRRRLESSRGRRAASYCGATSFFHALHRIVAIQNRRRGKQQKKTAGTFPRLFPFTFDNPLVRIFYCTHSLSSFSKKFE